MNPGLTAYIDATAWVRTTLASIGQSVTSRQATCNSLKHFWPSQTLSVHETTLENAKNHIVVENRFPCFHFAIFFTPQNGPTCRHQSPTLCNWVFHTYKMEHLRLWLAFAVDFEDNYELSALARLLANNGKCRRGDYAQEISKLEKFKEQ
jgi:hypothetical protein